MDYHFCTTEEGTHYLKVSLTDYALINNSLLNKGMAFTNQEREDFCLFGLLPPHETDINTQRKRVYNALNNKSSNLDKYIFLRKLQDSNETLFYNLICENIVELLPLVYTPTVGLGCQQYSHFYKRPRGLFISYPDRQHIDKILSNSRFDNTKVIVVSDGERILGLGDQGAGGMGIPIGKLSLYTACAGIYPAYTLPILLDVGTNNQELLNDPLYVGWQNERVRGADYDEFIDLFVNAVKKRFPHVVLQWEDFAQQNANPILERYRNQICTFNDDIQGTAAVAAGTLLAAIRLTNSKLADQRIVVVGAGSAGCGISNLIMQAMIEEGMSAEEARQRFFLIDRYGLLIEGTPNLLSFQLPFVQPKGRVSSWQLENVNQITFKDVVDNIKPTLLIGVSGQPGIFTEEIIKTMAAQVQRPIIFPLSNPTSRCEATPSDLMKWTEGRAIIGTGSPFNDIIKEGKPFRVDQTNNSYIFPGVGLGLIAVQAQHVTDKMFMAAAQALAECSPAKLNPNNNLLPPLTKLREVSLKVAVAVANEAIQTGLAIPPSEPLETYIRKLMWTPEYLPYKKL